MGGRGASSGISEKGKKYGTEFSTLLKEGNIKFVKYNDSKSAKTPQETMTKGRVYVTVNDKEELSSITYYDTKGKRTKIIDLMHSHNDIKGNHAHHGYIHKENDGPKGATNLTPEEKRMVEFVKKIWLNRKRK